MIRNYIVTTLRAIARKKGFSLLNVLGLSIGLAASLLILQYVKDELSFDDFHTHGDQLYRVRYDLYRDKEMILKSATSFPKMAPTMKADFPEVENTCRLYLLYGGTLIRYNEMSIHEDNVFMADQSFLEMFSFPLIAGDRASALAEPNTAVIEEQTAKKYFGSENPLGKRLRTPGGLDFEITGVIKSPENSHLKFSILLAYKTYPGYTPGRGRNDWEEAWGWYDFYNYVQLKPGADPKALEAKFPQYIKKYGREGDDKRIVFSLQPVRDIHLYSDLVQEARVNGNGRSVYFLMIIAFFILAIAWVNYVNLATARAVERAREVGVRKSVGADRFQLMTQFVSESFMINLTAVILAIVIVSMAIPAFNELSGKQLTTSLLFERDFWFAVLGLYVMGSVLSGLYPAVVLSSYQPSRVLKGSMKGSRDGMILRKGLVIVQFVSSVALISGTVIVYQQLIYMQQQDLGININQTLIIHAPEERRDSTFVTQAEAYKTEMLRHPSVSIGSVSTEIPGNLVYWTNGSKRLGQDRSQATMQMYRIGIDYDFFETFGNKIIAGRGYGRQFTGDSASVVVNRKAIDDLGFKSADEAVGSRITVGGDTLTIIGVIENYHQEGLKVDFRPTAFSYSPRNGSYFSFKVDAANMEQTIAFCREKYNSFFPGNPFNYFFLDTFFNRQYNSDQQFGRIFGLFSLLAIFVASLGLFGLASFTAAQRTKEIGIRKVLGSSVPNVFLLLSRDYLVLVGVANLIAVPMVWLLMENWLSSFAFRINIAWWVFLLSAFVTCLIALLTVTYQSLSAAMANPVKSLRYE